MINFRSLSQLVIQESKCYIIKDLLDRYKVPYDAIYSLNLSAEDASFAFYDQIYKDFKIKKEDIILKAMVLASVNLDNDELRYATRDQILFNGNVSKPFKSNISWNWNGLPCPTSEYRNVPVTLLVQNPFMNSSYGWMSLKHVHFSPSSPKLSSVFSFKINKQAIGWVNRKSNARKWNFGFEYNDCLVIEHEDHRRGTSLKPVRSYKPVVVDPIPRSKSQQVLKVAKNYFAKHKNIKWKINFDKKLFSDQNEQCRSRVEKKRLLPWFGICSTEVCQYLENVLAYDQNILKTRAAYLQSYKYLKDSSRVKWTSTSIVK